MKTNLISILMQLLHIQSDVTGVLLLLLFESVYVVEIEILCYYVNGMQSIKNVTFFTVIIYPLYSQLQWILLSL